MGWILYLFLALEMTGMSFPIPHSQSNSTVPVHLEDNMLHYPNLKPPLWIFFHPTIILTNGLEVASPKYQILDILNASLWGKGQTSPFSISIWSPRGPRRQYFQVMGPRSCNKCFKAYCPSTAGPIPVSYMLIVAKDRYSMMGLYWKSVSSLLLFPSFISFWIFTQSETTLPLCTHS